MTRILRLDLIRCVDYLKSEFHFKFNLLSDFYYILCLIFILMSIQTYSSADYIKKFPDDRRSREYWKLYKVRGTLDNRHLNFVLCKDCSDKIYKDQEKLEYIVDKNGNFTAVRLKFELCEDCIARNLYETNSYIYKYSLKRKNNQPENTVTTPKKEKKSKVKDDVNSS